MKIINKKAILSFVILFVLLFGVNIVFAKSNLSNSSAVLKSTAEKAGYDSGTNAGTIDSVVQKGINAALSFLGVVFLLLMIYGGYIWMLARGNEQEVEKSKQIITAAIIGLVIVISAYAISILVMQSLAPGTIKK